MDAKLGVYICSGCEIGDSLEVGALEKVATGELKAPVCKTHECLCGAEGVELIKNDIESEELTGILIAACSSRFKNEEFRFDGTVVERAAVRELVAWTQPKGEDDTKMAAEDYLRIGFAKLKGTSAIVLEDVNIDSTILVVGGGVAGMTAALEASKAGYKSILVDKEPELGGLWRRMHKQYPTTEPFEAIEDNTVAALVKEVEANDDITVHTSAEMESISGAPGMFDLKIKTDGSTVEGKAGAIVLATGATPYDGSKLEHLGYGKSDRVVTSLEFEEMAAAGKLGKVDSVAFIQCAGSRDKEHLPYCSNHCCMTSLKQAKYIRELGADNKAYIFYKDMRTLGLYEGFYRNAQDDAGIFLTKGDVTSIEPSGRTVAVEVDNTLLGEKIQVNVDLLVLAVGMVPSTKTGTDFDNTLLLPAVTADDDEKKKDEKEEASNRPPSKALHLQYRQGPELPNLEYGFPDSHFICFPYETRRTGIYAAGSVRRPGDMADAKQDGAGAVLKAIQCVEMVSRGEATHPRSGDQSYLTIDLGRCTQCKRCTEECPFGALNEDAKANPLPNPTRCRRCATCMGACPERVISFQNYGVSLIGNQLKSIEVPDEFEEKPRILVFVCENDAMPALDLIALERNPLSPWIRVIPLRCLGSVNLVWVADALGRGIDGMLLLGCKHGEDYQCHFVKGSELCNIRLSKVQETLQRLVLEPERIRLEQVQISDYKTLPTLIKEFSDEIAEMDPNPYKDM